MLTRPRLITIALAAAALAAPAAASADSIVYIDQGNVWTMQPDGSGKVQLTDGGGWHSPTQADDGTIAAVQGTGPIRVMGRDGRPLRSISTPGAPSSNGGTFAPAPVDLSFSPDGSKIAYAYTNYSCPVASPSCGTLQRSTFYTRADVTEATPHGVWGNQFGVSDPEWVTNDRALVFGGYGSQVSIDDLGGGDDSFDPWMTPNGDQGDGELSRDGRKLATTWDYGPDTQLRFFAVSGDARSGPVPSEPVLACTTVEGDEAYSDPTWAPDSLGLGFVSHAGIETLRFTKVDSSGCATTGSSKVVVPGGSQPDWGPAEPAAARYRDQVTASQAPPPAQKTATPVVVTPRPVVPAPVRPAQATLKATVGGAARQAFRGAVAVVCEAPGATACSAIAVARVGGKAYRAKGAGAQGKRMTLRFSAKGTKAIRAALRRGKPVRATVTVTARGESGAAGTARRTIKLTR